MIDTHLDEAERHGAADGSLAADRAAVAAEHLATCAACAADVERIRSVMTRAAQTSSMPNDLDTLWPAVRSRIERSKVVPLPADGTPSPMRRRMPPLVWGGVAAAVVLVASVMLLRSRPPAAAAGPVASNTAATTELTTVADSARLYEQEAQTLLNELELRRSMLRPEAAQTIDHDLKIIDSAIADLRDAIARDPRNPALQRLLADSYRQKVDLLKRTRNAG